MCDGVINQQNFPPKNKFAFILYIKEIGVMTENVGREAFVEGLPAMGAYPILFPEAEMMDTPTEGRERR